MFWTVNFINTWLFDMNFHLFYFLASALFTKIWKKKDFPENFPICSTRRYWRLRIKGVSQQIKARSRSNLRTRQTLPTTTSREKGSTGVLTGNDFSKFWDRYSEPSSTVRPPWLVNHATDQLAPAVIFRCQGLWPSEGVWLGVGGFVTKRALH